MNATYILLVLMVISQFVITGPISETCPNFFNVFLTFFILFCNNILS